MFRFLDNDGKTLVWFEGQANKIFLRHVKEATEVVPVIDIEYPLPQLPPVLIMCWRMRELGQSPYVFFDETRGIVEVEIYFYLETDRRFLLNLYPPLSRIRGLEGGVEVGMLAEASSRKDDIDEFLMLAQHYGGIRIDIGKRNFNRGGVSLFCDELIYNEEDSLLPRLQ
ncbi:MAG: hypothetical protein HYX23_00940 [Candidatus Zambryskibacteria bacterium]|nr:hypothetical protein [Candidatus Zambryskibacteria bacterium]